MELNEMIQALFNLRKGLNVRTKRVKKNSKLYKQLKELAYECGALNEEIKSVL